MASGYHRSPKVTTTPQGPTSMPILYEASSDDANDRMQVEEECVEEAEVKVDEENFLDEEETVNMIDDFVDQLGHEEDQWSEDSFGGGSLLMAGVGKDGNRQQDETSTPIIREDETEAMKPHESSASAASSNRQIGEAFDAESFDGDGDCASSYEEISLEDDEDEQHEANVVEQEEIHPEANTTPGEHQFENSSPESTQEDMTNEEESQGCHSDLNSQSHQFSVEENLGQGERQVVSTHDPSTIMYAQGSFVSYDARMDLTSDDDDDNAAANEILGEADSHEAKNTCSRGNSTGTLDKPIIVVDDSCEEHADETSVEVSEEPDRAAIAGVMAEKPIVFVDNLYDEDFSVETDLNEEDYICATDENENEGKSSVTSETNGDETTFVEGEESAKEPRGEYSDTDILEDSKAMSFKSGEKSDLVIDETLDKEIGVGMENNDLLVDTGDTGPRPAGEVDRYSDKMRSQNLWEGCAKDDDDGNLSEPNGEIAEFALDCDIQPSGDESQASNSSEPRKEAELVTHIIPPCDDAYFEEYALPADDGSDVNHYDQMESYEDASFVDYVPQTDEGSYADHEDERIEREADIAVILDDQSNKIDGDCISQRVVEIGREDTGANTRPRLASDIQESQASVYIDAECEELLFDENMPLDEVFVCGSPKDDGSASSLGIYANENEGDTAHQECRGLGFVQAAFSDHMLDGSTDPNPPDGDFDQEKLEYEPDYSPSCEGNEERQILLIPEPMSQTVFYPEPMKRSRFGRSSDANARAEYVEDAQLLASDEDNHSAAEGSEINPIVLDDTMYESHTTSDAGPTQITETQGKDTEQAIVPSVENDLRACLEAFGYYLDQRFEANSFENDMSQTDFLHVGLEPPSGGRIYRSVPWNPDPDVDGGIIVRRQDISRVPSSLLGDFAREDGVVRSVLAKDSPSQETVSNKSDSASIYTNPQADVPTPLIKGAHVTDRLGTSLVVPSGTDDQDGGSGVEYSVIAESLGMGGVEDALLETHSNKTEEKSRKSVTWNEFAQVRSDDPHLSGPLRVHETTHPRPLPQKDKGGIMKKACEIFHEAPFWTKVLVYVSISLFCIAFGIIITAVLGSKPQESSGSQPIPWIVPTHSPSASPTSLRPTVAADEIVEHSSPTVSPTTDETKLDGIVNVTATPTATPTAAPGVATDPISDVISPEPTPAPSGQSSAPPVRDGSWLWGKGR